MGAPLSHSDAPNAALLIDFDNVTMGMRSDLSKELKNLLNSDIIKGKVTVQRAYADWRRYPQYIVPLSENSVDLIFAPAYGSSKKNATDIRMAIDAIELVFIRPEIGTFILLTGDSDFSSLVLKLKEYGKYVIGVGIQESSSDILVQNCDEYYSYTALTGLRKTTDSANKPVDPWVLVEKAVERMASRDDVMRSDRLKQVMIEIDPSFDEGNFGFSKFSKFLSDAAGRSLLRLRKLENGQYEVAPHAGAKAEEARDRSGPQRRPEARERPRDRDREREEPSPKTGHPKEGKEDQPSVEPAGTPDARSRPPRGAGGARDRARTEKPGKDEPAPAPSGEVQVDPLKAAYGLLTQALKELTADGEEAARDSDLKRKMLEIRPEFDEGELGFGKFSRFLRQAHDHEVVDLQKREEGTYQVAFRREIIVEGKSGAPAAGPPVAAAPTPDGEAPEAIPPRSMEEGPREPLQTEREKATSREKAPSTPTGTPVGLRFGSGRRRGAGAQGGPPPLLEGQVVPGSRVAQPALQAPPPEEPQADPPSGGTPRTPRGRRGEAKAGGQEEIPLEFSQPTGEPVDPEALGLPTDGPAMIRYLTHSYKGVGQKTAEVLVETFGPGLYQALNQDPERIVQLISAGRAGQLLKAWRTDLARRLERGGEEGAKAVADPPEEKPSPSRHRTRRSGRSRSRDERKPGDGEGAGPQGDS